MLADPRYQTSRKALFMNQLISNYEIEFFKVTSNETFAKIEKIPNDRIKKSYEYVA